MAFVYRSPRNLGYKYQNRPEQLQQEQDEMNEAIISRAHTKQNRKQPIKGLSLKKEQKGYDAQLPLGKDNRTAPKIHSGQCQIVKNKKYEAVPKQQYFFKSNCDKRTVNDPLKQNKQYKVKEIIEKQFCKKITHQKTKHYINSEQKRYMNQTITKFHGQDALKNRQISQLNKKSKQSRQADKRLPCLMSKQAKNSGINMNLLHSKKLSSKIYAIPSIPGRSQKFGYVIKEEQLSYPKNVGKNRFQGEKADFPGPTDYFICERKKIKGVLKFRSFKNESNKSITNDFYALIDDQQALKKHNQKIKEWVKQGKEIQKQIKKKKKQKDKKNLPRDTSVDSNQSGVTVYQDDVTPGPGYYNFSLGLKNSFRSSNQKFSKIFFSQAERFQDFNIKYPFQPLSSVHSQQQNQTNELSKKKKRNKFFISKLQRNTKLENQSEAPSPCYYDVRISMQNDIISKILRNSPNLFNNKLPRLVDPVSSIAPGPGYYNVSLPEFKVESFKPQLKQQSTNTKKQANSLKESEQILIGHLNQSRRTHEKRDQVVQKQNKAPFLSSSPKKSIIGNPSLTDFHTSIPMQRQKRDKPKQNLCGFNSSTQKTKYLSPRYEAEVGLYEVVNETGWDKKSFNVLFN